MYCHYCEQWGHRTRDFRSNPQSGKLGKGIAHVEDADTAPKFPERPSKPADPKQQPANAMMYHAEHDIESSWVMGLEVAGV
jgi:hypothetical protein